MHQVISSGNGSGNDFAMGERGLGFDSRARQIGHGIATGSQPLRHFFGCLDAKPQVVAPLVVTRFDIIPKV